MLKKILQPKKTQINLSFNGSPISDLYWTNTEYIKYTLASEDNSVTRDLEIDRGSCFIEATSDDLVTFFTRYPMSQIWELNYLYWGAGLPIDGSQADNDDYSYISEDTVKVSKGVALDSLELDRLPMYAAYITNVGDKVFTVESVSINGFDINIIPDDSHYDTNYNLANCIQDFMSYTTAKTLEFSVVVRTDNGSTTLTGSVDLSKDNKLLIDGSSIN